MRAEGLYLKYAVRRPAFCPVATDCKADTKRSVQSFREFRINVLTLAYSRRNAVTDRVAASAHPTSAFVVRF